MKKGGEGRPLVRRSKAGGCTDAEGTQAAPSQQTWILLPPAGLTSCVCEHSRYELLGCLGEVVLHLVDMRFSRDPGRERERQKLYCLVLKHQGPFWAAAAYCHNTQYVYLTYGTYFTTRSVCLVVLTTFLTRALCLCVDLPIPRPA